MQSGLDLTDIEFLQTVRTINANPDEFPYTEKGERPASTRSIRESTDLSREQVRYRLGGSNSRGLEDAGLIVVHSAVYDEEKSQYGPKSVELTEKGLKQLERAEKTFAGDNTADSDEVEELRERVDALENTDIDGDVDTNAVVDELRAVSGRLESLEDTVERIDQEVATLRDEVSAIQESDWGEIDDEIVEDLVLVLQRAPAMLYAFDSVLGVDVDQVVDDGAFSEKELRSTQAKLFETLAEAANASVASESGDHGGSDQASNGRGGQDSGSTPDREITPPSGVSSESSPSE